MSKKKKSNLNSQTQTIESKPAASVPAEDSGQEKCPASLVNTVTPILTLKQAKIIALPAERKTISEDIHHFPPKDFDAAFVAEAKIKFSESNCGNAYEQDGELKLSGAKVTLWQDKDCTTPIELQGGSLSIPNHSLKQGVSCYIRAEEAGNCKVELKLNASSKSGITVEQALSKSITIESSNRVSAFIKAEHLIVLREKDLSKKQRKNDSLAGSAAAEAEQHIFSDASRIELSALQTADNPAYKGKGQLILTPANADVYSDAECTTKFDANGKIDFDKLSGSEPLKLWLRGKTAGKFKIQLKLDPPDDDTIVVDKPAEGELGCVDLKLKLFDFKKNDINLAVEPDVADLTTYWDQLKNLNLEQKEMSDAERIGTGRVLHIQKDGHHARAKIVIEKANAAHWPDAAKDYKLVLNTADADKKGKKRSGSIKVFDAETQGSNQTLPHKITLADAKAKQQTFWVEGSGICDGWRGIRLSLGIDREKGGPDKTEKWDADWGSFTICKIKEIKCDVDNDGAGEKYVEDGNKVFINIANDARTLKSVNGKRKAEVTAEIEPKLKDLEVFFSIVEHKDNYAITDLPDEFKQTKIGRLKQTIKPIDKDDPKKLLHMSVKTDENGKAKIETLQAPQMGLHKFKIGAYILSDVHHARYIEEHSDLGKYKPAHSKDWLEVWRRVFFRVVAMKRWSGASYLDRFDQGALESKTSAVGIKLERSLAPVEKDYEIAQPHVLNWAKAALGGAAPERTMYLCLINGRGDKGSEEDSFDLGNPTFKQIMWTLPYIRFRNITNKADWLVHMKLSYDGNDYELTNKTTIEQTGDFEFKLHLDVDELWEQIKTSDGEAKANDMLANASIEFKYKQEKSSSGLSWGEAVVVCMDTREPDHATENAKDSASHTFLHEIGHYVGLAAKFQPDYDNSENPNFYSERNGERSARGKGGYGVGPHCDGLNDNCVVWYQFKMTQEYCPRCKLMMRARNLFSLKADARAEF
ncbi:MAG: hypothetical protein OEZ58_06480 [Gammaproteobacteria bacterium]|nr:hypothetical protein [Gammaproteobacteria bacterium]